MRHLFLVAALAFMAASLAQAQEVAQPPLPGRVQLVEDDTNGMLRVLFDGSEVAHCRAPEAKIDCDVIAPEAAFLPAVNEPAPLPEKIDGGAP